MNDSLKSTQPNDPQSPVPHQSALQALDWLQNGAGMSPDEGERMKMSIKSERLAKHHWWES